MPIRARVVVVMVAVMLAASGSAQAAWSPPSTVTTDAGNPHVAALGGSDAVAVWLKHTPVNLGMNATTYVSELRASVRQSGTWGPPAVLAPVPTGPQTEYVQHPQVAGSANGAAAAVFTRFTCNGCPGPGSSNRETVQAVTRTPQGSWSGVQNLSTPDTSASDTSVSPPVVGAAQDGSFTAGWVDFSVSDPGPLKVATAPPNGAFATPETIPGAVSDNGDAFDLSVAPDGGVAVVWHAGTGGAGGPVWAAVRRAGAGSFSAPVQLQSGNNVQPRVAIGSGGKVTALFAFYDAGLGHRVLKTSTLPAAALPATGWTTPVTLYDAAIDSEVPLHAAALPDGTVEAAWTEGGYAKVAAQPPAATAFDAPVSVSDPLAQASFTVLATGADGTSAVTWYQENPLGRTIRAATLAPGAGAWELSPVLSPLGRTQPVIAVGPTGVANAVWAVPGPGLFGSLLGSIEAASTDSGTATGTGTGTTTTPAPSPAPAAGSTPPPAAAGVTFSGLRKVKGGVAVTLTLPGSLNGRPVTLKGAANAAGATVAAGTLKLKRAKAGRQALTLRYTKRGRKLLASKKKLTAKLKLTITSTGLPTTVLRRTAVLRP